MLLAAIAVGALLFSLLFFSPRLWSLLGPPAPGSAYWARGLQFSLQCEDPFGADLTDQGLVWRLAPAIVGHVLQLRGSATFLVPWAGLLVLLHFSAHLAHRFTRDIWCTAWFAALIGTTTTALTVTGWLGINDAWYACALLAVAFQTRLAFLLPALFIGPWIDERFVLALPLACLIHVRLFGLGQLKRVAVLAVASVVLYLGIRLTNPFGLHTQRAARYLSEAPVRFKEWLPWVSLGWFMGLRAAWLLALAPLAADLAAGRRRAAWALAAAMAAPLAVITVLAADTSRAPTMLLPLVVLGLVEAAARWDRTRLRTVLAALLAANVLMPAMHVTYKYSDIINMLPVELARLWRS